MADMFKRKKLVYPFLKEKKPKQWYSIESAIKQANGGGGEGWLTDEG